MLCYLPDFVIICRFYNTFISSQPQDGLPYELVILTLWPCWKFQQGYIYGITMASMSWWLACLAAKESAWASASAQILCLFQRWTMCRSDSQARVRLKPRVSTRNSSVKLVDCSGNIPIFYLPWCWSLMGQRMCALMVPTAPWATSLRTESPASERKRQGYSSHKGWGLGKEQESLAMKYFWSLSE